MDDLEQYGGRTNLRFHNVRKPGTGEGAHDTETTVIKICADMGVTITPHDIDRSHPIGRPNRCSKIQITCRFRN